MAYKKHPSKLYPAKLSYYKGALHSAEAFISAENRVLQEQVNELDNVYVQSQREVYALRETLRKQKKLLDRIPKEVLEAVQEKKARKKRRLNIMSYYDTLCNEIK